MQELPCHGSLKDTFFLLCSPMYSLFDNSVTRSILLFPMQCTLSLDILGYSYLLRALLILELHTNGFRSEDDTPLDSLAI